MNIIIHKNVEKHYRRWGFTNYYKGIVNKCRLSGKVHNILVDIYTDHTIVDESDSSFENFWPKRR